ncbi:glycosyltransferase family 2 protein [Paenibacillus spiritus]|uniref:Glycosyltransferase family 2 protein n=1 Tax=Paenibacillus spiritus TaxID=2496557 RepID=A0A5J5FVA6_9BACL|nr:MULTISPECIES: glycosyltransferase family 2 protein [Paenibacillus]KAA8997563.1 glycosyltransferase family 2 protein [Paenibacillus spiritus]
MVPTLTVFTPAYNRASTLPMCYESLKRQTCRDFVWLIVDDGSTDRTRELVESWIAEGQVDIRYHYQDNQGMHGAHNTAYELMDTELNVCIDSDDYMADEAVKTILDFWREHGGENVAGIVGLDASPAGEVIGTRLPEGMKAAPLSHLYDKHGVLGDKKLVYRTRLIQSAPPYPLFPGERYVPLAYKYLLIDQQYPLLLLNRVLCHVEYRTDGSSLNMFSQYRANPRGFAFYRKTAMRYSPTLRKRFREAIHYVSSSLMIRNRRFLSESPNKALTLLAAPLGSLLYFYIQRTSRSAPASVTKQSGTAGSQGSGVQ